MKNDTFVFPARGEPVSDSLRAHLQTIGSSTAAGGIYGFSSHFFKAFRSAPPGSRFVSGIRSACVNAPRCAGSFAFWAAGAYRATYYAVLVLRQREDTWTPIITATFTGMLYKMGQGFRPAVKMGLGCATAIGVVNGVSYALVKTYNQGELTSLADFRQRMLHHYAEYLRDGLLGAAIIKRPEDDTQALQISDHGPE